MLPPVVHLLVDRRERLVPYQCRSSESHRLHRRTCRHGLKTRFVQKLNEPSSGSGFFSLRICGSGCVATPAVRGSTAASGSLGKINVPRFKRLYLSSCRLSVTKPLPCPVHPSPPPPSSPVIFPPCRPEDKPSPDRHSKPPALMEGNGIRSLFDLLIISAEMIISALPILP